MGVSLLSAGRTGLGKAGGASSPLAWTGAAPARGHAPMRRAVDRSSRAQQQQRQQAASLAPGHDGAESLPCTNRYEDTYLLESLHRNPHWLQSGRPGVDLMAADRSALQGLPQIFVILFGLDNSQQEGIYSLRALGNDSMPQDTIIAFQSKDDADRYACLLEVTMEPHTPQVYSISAGELFDFCRDRCHQCRLEPAGTLLLPPDYSVGLTDWERASKLRNGSYAVLTADPEPSGQASSSADTLLRSAAQGVQAVQLPSSSGCSHQATGSGTLAMAEHGPPQHQQHQQRLGEEELDAIRNQLEALLPGSEESSGGGAGHA